MSIQAHHFAHDAAVEVYGTFLEECVVARVSHDRVGPPPKPSKAKIDGRPVRLVTLSGKGGWSEDPDRAQRWAGHDNISLLDHVLSVARGALMFWLADAPRPWSTDVDLAEIERLSHALVCIAFLHDIDKDLELPRGTRIAVEDVAERMSRYGIDDFLRNHRVRITPAAMRSYIEEVEGSQAARSPVSSDYDRRIAATCRYVELADKLEGMFLSRTADAGVDGVIASLRDPNRWPVLWDATLRQWRKIEIHDHLHDFLLDRFQRALSAACTEVAGRLPLIEMVHDGRLLCVIPREHAAKIGKLALDRFLGELPYRLDFSVNNKLTPKFVGGAASWQSCRDLMRRTADWRRFVNLLALPRAFAVEHQQAIDDLFDAAGMATSWGGAGATEKPALHYPGGEPLDLDLEPAHALVFLITALNHADTKRKGAAPDADKREQELSNLLRDHGSDPPRMIAQQLAPDGRARRVLLALWAIAEVWRAADDDRDEGQELLDRIVGRDGLVGLWLEGNDTRTGLVDQVEDIAGVIKGAVCRRFAAYLDGSQPEAMHDGGVGKRCILCNEPAAHKVETASRAHGIKATAFSGRDGRNDHLASPSRDTHLCPVCLAELQLRQNAQEKFKGSRGLLPPLISSPLATGLFGGLAFQNEAAEESMSLYDLNRLDIKKGTVYEGLDCQTRRIRLARLEELPATDAELVAKLRMTLTAVRRVGRPIHIFRGAPHRHPAIFYMDTLPPWLRRLLGGDSLRIEQVPHALKKLELYGSLSKAPGLGIEWAKRLADPDASVRLGALCVAWAHSIDRLAGDTRDSQTQFLIRDRTREEALALIQYYGGEQVNLKDNLDPLIRLAWLATRIQRRVGIRASTNKQLLCWKTAMDFYPSAERSTSNDTDALILGLAGTLHERLTRGDKSAAAAKHRDGQPLDEACIDFARHFAGEVWTKVFRSREPTSQEQRRASAIYRFALFETYRERRMPESMPETTPESETED